MSLLTLKLVELKAYFKSPSKQSCVSINFNVSSAGVIILHIMIDKIPHLKQQDFIHILIELCNICNTDKCILSRQWLKILILSELQFAFSHPWFVIPSWGVRTEKYKPGPHPAISQSETRIRTRDTREHGDRGHVPDHDTDTGHRGGWAGIHDEWRHGGWRSPWPVGGAQRKILSASFHEECKLQV